MTAENFTIMRLDWCDMPKISTRVTFNKASVRGRIKAASTESLPAVTMQALKDANQYCPEDQHDLVNSGLTNSEPEKGIMRWATVYARMQYYGVVMEGRAPKVATNRPLKYTKPGAHKMWAHYARAQHGEDWKNVYQAEFRRLMRNGTTS